MWTKELKSFVHRYDQEEDQLWQIEEDSASNKSKAFPYFHTFFATDVTHGFHFFVCATIPRPFFTKWFNVKEKEKKEVNIDGISK